MEFKLPELGEGVHEGELIKWKVAVGDQVKDDQALCEIMTDKATMEIPSPFSGTITKLHVKEGEVVKVNQVMITAETSAGGGAASKKEESKNAATAAQSAPKSEPVKTQNSVSAPVANQNINAGVLASPSTRKLAYERGVNLQQVSGTGPRGRILREDLERFLSGGLGRKLQPVIREDRIPFRGMRKKISEKMRLSKDKAAHFTYVEEADASELVKLRTAAKTIAEAKGIKLTFLPFILKGMVEALKKHPNLNSTLDESTNEIVIKHYYNIGISVQTDDGLTVVVVKHVETKSILEIAKEIQDLVTKARSKKLALEDLTGGTITLTNAGSIGGLFATPVINFPEVAILGFNKISRKPVVKNIGGVEKIVIRDWTYFSISLDHRLVDGAEAAEFMKTFIHYMENPALLLMENL